MGFEVLERQRGNKGYPKLDFLQMYWEKETKMEVWLVTHYMISDMAAEVVHLEAFSCGKKGAEVEDDEIEGRRTPQYASNVEIFEIGAHVPLIPITHEIGKAYLGPLTT
jgi:hypothetical protein